MTTPSVTTRTGSHQTIIARRPSPWAYVALDQSEAVLLAIARAGLRADLRRHQLLGSKVNQLAWQMA